MVILIVKITNLADPTSDKDAVSRKYLEKSLQKVYVKQDEFRKLLDTIGKDISEIVKKQNEIDDGVKKRIKIMEYKT